MTTNRENTVTLVLGGVRSGKSRYAQELAERAKRVVFIATATAFDDEMQAKIQKHRDDRPSHWHTIEEPLEIANAIAAHDTSCDCIVVDCLTIFAATLLEHHAEDHEAIAARSAQLCDALLAARCDVVLVSNEVGSGVVPSYALGRRYRDLLGELNQRVAAVADNALYFVAGLPLVLKGRNEMAP
ncbi:bifunctional adenosylcobinamide kinase/adenosylcobinamide-phosphate guanylyltransferase [Silvibacterium acidisoli]|uniref:bifunctional adenosylcobinamide kinase/adenosylcobinamide-phosphate guanylyltransferase n=1 Tax=Acidobacteriaceae bacterium ZG23-2 TaxID=2883246 RepID=UPI00406C5BDC